MWNVIHFDEINSTQTYAKENNFPPYTIITARHQTNGVGQHGRVWEDSHQSVMLTAVLPVPKMPVALFTQYIALSIIEQLRVYRDDIQIKWPNDLVIKRKKLGGILTEVIDDVMYLGIGINITTPNISTGCGVMATCQEAIYDEIQSHIIAVVQQPIKENKVALLNAHVYYHEGIVINGVHCNQVSLTHTGALKVNGEVYVDSRFFPVFYK